MRIFVVVLVFAACSERRELSEPCIDCTVRVHPAGILDETSDEFHGLELERHGWDFAVCAACHGDDLSGGIAKSDCTTCHTEGPTACVTCHGDGPTTASHLPHRTAQVACSECHTVPTTWDGPGHILGDSPPAEITFGARAQLTPVAADRSGPPAFVDGACTNVYCHGATLLAAGGAATVPRWDEPAASSCGRCHGAPPPSHTQSACASCHPASAPHIDGITQVGSSCDGCHGSAASPAPPRDLAGNMFTTALGVGAHQAHLTVPSGLRDPIACATCHLVPAALTALGHVDTPAPAEVEPTLGWNRTSATCTTAWCHGVAQPVWTTTGSAACGTCHGIPPATPNHTAGMALATCASCHPSSMSLHMNGAVDVL